MPVVPASAGGLPALRRPACADAERPPGRSESARAPPVPRGLPGEAGQTRAVFRPGQPVRPTARAPPPPRPARPLAMMPPAATTTTPTAPPRRRGGVGEVGQALLHAYALLADNAAAAWDRLAQGLAAAAAAARCHHDAADAGRAEAVPEPRVEVPEERAARRAGCLPWP